MGFVKSLAKKMGYAIAALIILTAVLVFIARSMTPLLEEHKAEFESYASEMLQTPVSIKRIRVSWFKYQPVIGLHSVTLLDKNTKQPLLQLKKVNILFSIPQSIWERKFVPSGLLVSGADVSISQSSTGEFTVKELSSLNFGQSATNATDAIKGVIGWLSQEPRLILRNIDIHYTGYQQSQRDVTLYDLSFENVGISHNVNGKAILHQELPTEVSVSARWEGSTFDLSRIKAKAYLYVSGLSLSQWAKERAWKDWQIDEGIASAKIWLAWENGVFQKIQSTLQLYGLKVSSPKNHVVHTINRVSGNLGWKLKGDEQIFAGDEILLDLPKHLWPITSFSVTLSSDQNGVLTPKKASIGYVDLNDVQSFLLDAKPLLPESFAKGLSALKIHGGMQHTNLTFGGAWNDWSQLSFQADFNQVGFSSWESIPGVENLTGNMTWNGAQGELKLNSSRVSFKYPAVFTKDISVDQLSGNIQLQRDPNNTWIFQTSTIQLLNSDLAANVSGTLTVPAKGAPVSDLTGNFTLQQSAHVSRYLPLQIFEPELRAWLKQAFLAGEAQSGHAVLRGPLNEFPFEKGNGEFTIGGKVSNVDFRFAPDWPILENISGELLFSGTKMVVDIDHAETLGVSTSGVHAEIPYLTGGDKPVILEVKTEAINSDFAKGLDYIRNSPLNKTLGKMFKDVEMQGPIRLLLGLTIPLKNPDTAKVAGDLSFTDSAMKLVPWKLNLADLNGQLSFTESTITSKGIKGLLFNKPFQFDLASIQKSKAKSVVEATFNNELTISDLQDWLKLPFGDLVKGTTEVNGAIDFSLDAPLEIKLKSNLAGITVNLADQYGKNASEIRSFSTDIFIQENQPVKLKAAYGDLLNVAVILGRKNEAFTLEAATLQFGMGVPAWPEAPGIYINGQFDTLNLDKIKSYASQSTGSSISAATLKGIDVSTNKLQLGDTTLNQVHVQATPADKNWNVVVNSEEVVGKLTVPTIITRRSVITAQLDKINLHTLPAGSKKSSLFDVKTLPGISLVANNVAVNDMQFGQVTFKAKPSSSGLTIQTLRINSNRLDLNSTGDWVQAGSGSRTHLRGSAVSSNVSSLLRSLGLNVNNFVASNGNLEFDLNWADAPYAPALADLNGRASLNLGEGRIVDVGRENGAKMDLGRMLSIFSLQTIPRRLTLDFSDIFQKGYSFDYVKGDFAIDSGDLRTTNLRFDGPVARIGINGRIGLKNNDYNFILSVTAHVTSSIPVAATLLTGNPLIGLGAFAVNAVIGSQVSKAASNYYSVTGPWDNPVWKSVNSGGR